LRVLEAAESIAHGKFDAKPSYNCAFCPYRNLCPATEKVILASPKKSPRTN
jgi:CRISPR/Cas system-associated exonuclease Cas4 (RecB family)